MEVRLSVRELVQFLMRGGDIDNRHVASPEKAMQEGSKIHRKIQAGMGPGYVAEVPLSHSAQMESDVAGEMFLHLDGRADGIFEMDGIVFIDEIKSLYRDVNKLKEPILEHHAQAKCYAYMRAVECELEEIGVRMTYVSLENENIRYFDEKYSFDELSLWFESLLGEYRKWMELKAIHDRKRDATIAGLPFPYPYRSGQKDLVENVYKTIFHGRKLFLEAPTGVGKTLATIYPAVMAIGNHKGDRIFYLTAKTITRTAPMEAFSLLRANGLIFRTLVITGKEKACLHEFEEGDNRSSLPCNPDKCKFARGHYDRVNEAMYDCLCNEEAIDREVVAYYAGKHRVCPFELSLDLSLFCDGIICDYNYVFDPHVYLKRFFADGTGSDAIFLVDEAHNLVDRGREMYSAQLYKEDFLDLKHTIKDALPHIAKQLDACNRELLSLKRACPVVTTGIGVGGLLLALDSLSVSIGRFLEDRKAGERLKDIREAILRFYFDISHFLLIGELLDEHYVTYGKVEEDGRFRVKLYNVDPSANLYECMARGRCSVLFSATFLPIQYYKKLLGGRSDDYEVYADSTFDPARRGLFIGKDVTSRYTSRGEEEYRKYAQYIRAIATEKTGNYMVFFPSFAFLKSVYSIFESEEYDSEQMECLLQEPGMKEEERESFLDAFKNIKRDEKSKSLIGFCVLGGLFSEGIDLREDALIGAIIVGTGIPMVGEERTILKDYFDEREGNGFDYAYRYPGMNKVLQAAGRVIRTSEDVGVVALLDYRFMSSDYRRMFPREWSGIREVDRRGISTAVYGFWEDFK